MLSKKEETETQTDDNNPEWWSTRILYSKTSKLMDHAKYHLIS